MASGLIFRSLETRADFDLLADIHQAAAFVDQVDPASARERIPTSQDLARTFPLDRTRDSADFIIAVIDRQIAGYVHVLWRWTEATGVRVFLHLGLVHPDWRGQGIGAKLVRKAQYRIREIAREEGCERPAVMATNVASTEGRAVRLMDSEGYTVVRTLSDMAAHPTTIQKEKSLAPGLRIKTLTPAQARSAYTAWKDAYRNSILATPENEADFEDFRASWFTEGTTHRVRGAMKGDDVVGFVVSQQVDNVGVIHEVSVRGAFQRRGIATVLLIDSMQTLVESGATQIRLFTDADNGSGARSLYESLGFRELKQHFLYRRPLI